MFLESLNGRLIDADALRLAAVLGALALLAGAVRCPLGITHLAAFCAAFATLLADEATAKNCQAGAQATTVLLLLHDDGLGRLLRVLHLREHQLPKKTGPNHVRLLTWGGGP